MSFVLTRRSAAVAPGAADETAPRSFAEVGAEEEADEDAAEEETVAATGVGPVEAAAVDEVGVDATPTVDEFEEADKGVAAC